MAPVGIDESLFQEHRCAHYMLRRCLVRSKADEIIAETVEFCRANSIAEIIWKCDAEAFNHDITPLSLVREFIEILKRACDQTIAAGLTHSINPWITLKWEDFGRDQTKVHPRFRWRVALDGRRAKGCVCLRCEHWREYLCEAYGLYATTHPAVLWLEDDFKTFMAGGGCYCNDCLQAFSETVGEVFTREHLLARILAPGQPDPLRAKWIDFLGQEMIETCRRLEKTVHGVHAGTRLGIMGSWSSDGRWWREASEILAGPNPAISRPSLAPYVEGRATEFMPDRFDVVKEMISFGPQTQQCPELENSTYSPFTKSMRTTRQQLILSQLLGNHAITMNLFDMVGTPMVDDPRVGLMLRESKPFLDALAAACGPGGIPRGVGMLWRERMADAVPLREGEGVTGFRTDGEGWAAPLQGAGLPVIWSESPVAALTGRIVYCLSEEEVLKLLAQGVLLDGSAAASLQDLGYGQYLGTRVGQRLHRYDRELAAEEFFDRSLGARPGLYMDFRRYTKGDHFYQLEPHCAARVVSHYVNPDEVPVFPAMIVHENSLGGRVAVYAFDLSGELREGFMNWTRKKQLASIVRWLGGGVLGLYVEGGAWMVPFRRDYPGYVLVGVMNFETDDWQGIKMSMSWPYACPGAIHAVTGRRGWLPVKPRQLSVGAGQLSASFSQRVGALDSMALAFSIPGATVPTSTS